MEEGSDHVDSTDLSTASEGDRLLNPLSYAGTPNPVYRAYKRRWLILAVVAFLNVSNGMVRKF